MHFPVVYFIAMSHYVNAVAIMQNKIQLIHLVEIVFDKPLWDASANQIFDEVCKISSKIFKF